MLTSNEVRAIVKARTHTRTENTMPKIKVYKQKTAMIPVDSAKIASAYQCPWTNDLFATKRGYVNHLDDLRKTRMHRRARQKIQDRKFEDFCNQPSLDCIVNWIETNPEFLFDNAIRLAWASNKEKLLEKRNDFWAKITYLDVSYSNSVSNSHDAPRGKKTNWGGRETSKDGKPLPRGYPGFVGKIEYQMSHDIGWGSDLFKGLGINTGTGGGITECRYGFEVRIFLDDFPGLARSIENDRLQYEKDQLIEMIKNEYKPFKVPSYNYGTSRYFSW